MCYIIKAMETWDIKLKKFRRTSKRENRREKRNQCRKSDGWLIFREEKQTRTLKTETKQNCQYLQFYTENPKD